MNTPICGSNADANEDIGLDVIVEDKLRIRSIYTYEMRFSTQKKDITPTEVEYFLLIKASKSKHCCRDCSSVVTVNEGPAFPRRDERSSLGYCEHATDCSNKTTNRVISINFAQRCSPTFHSIGNTLARSVSWVCRTRLKNAKRRFRLSNWPASSVIRNIRRYSFSSIPVYLSRRWWRKSSPRTSTTRHAFEMVLGRIGFAGSGRKLERH